MIRLSPAALPAILLVVLASVPAHAAPPAHPFDGAWSVTATSESGSCRGPYRYPIVIRGGSVDDAGNNAVDASGQAGRDGRIAGTIRQGLANVSVKGRLSGSTGAGRWTLTGLAACSGRGTARRTG